MHLLGPPRAASPFAPWSHVCPSPTCACAGPTCHLALAPRAPVPASTFEPLGAGRGLVRAPPGEPVNCPHRWSINFAGFRSWCWAAAALTALQELGPLWISQFFPGLRDPVQRRAGRCLVGMEKRERGTCAGQAGSGEQGAPAVSAQWTGGSETSGIRHSQAPCSVFTQCRRMEFFLAGGLLSSQLMLL